MATFAEKKPEIMKFLKSKGGKATKAETDAFKQSIGVVSDPSLTTEGRVIPSGFESFSKAVEAGDSGKEFIIPGSNALAPQTTQPLQTVDQLRQDMLKIEEQQKLAEATRAADTATKAVQEREALIAPAIKGAKSTASVSTQLGQKRLKDLFAATGAQAGTGAAKQIAAEQGLQSQLGALDVEETRQRDAVAKDLATIQSEKAYLEGQIRSGTASAQTAQQIADLEAEELAKTQATQNDRTEFFNTIGRFSGDYQQEINRINSMLASGDNSEAWKVPYLETARVQKIQELGLDPTTGQPIAQPEGLVSAEAVEALKAYNSGFRTPQIMQILQDAGYTLDATGGVSGGGGTPTVNTAEQIANYNNLVSQLSMGRMSPNETIQYIADNRAQLAQNFGEAVVEQVTQELFAQANPQTESQADVLKRLETDKAINDLLNPPTEAPQDVDIANELRVVRDSYTDSDGNIMEDDLMAYLGRLSLIDRAKSDAIAKIYGFVAEE